MPTTTPTSTADILAWADLHGIESHGISMLFEYDDRRKTRPINLRPESRILRDTPVAALTDADGGLGHRVLPTGGAKARFGTNFLVVRRTERRGWPKQGRALGEGREYQGQPTPS